MLEFHASFLEDWLKAIKEAPKKEDEILLKPGDALLAMMLSMDLRKIMVALKNAMTTQLPPPDSSDEDSPVKVSPINRLSGFPKP